MEKTIKRTIAVIIIIALSICIGFLADKIVKEIDLSHYPLEYTPFVEKYSDEYGVPLPIIYATIKVESGFNSSAVSSAGATGLMQIMPDTFTWLQTLTNENYEPGMLYDPETNIKYGTYYLSYLYKKFGVWETVFAAYNAGAARISGWIEDGLCDDVGKLTDIPIEETKNYVAKMNSAYAKYEELYFAD